MKPKRRFGTLLMVAGLAVAAGYSAWTAPPKEPKSRYFEAGQDGHLLEVAKPSTTTRKEVLIKAEPGMILDHGSELKLRAGLIAKIEAIDAEWTKEKPVLESRLADAAASVQQQNRASMMTLRTELSDYSELSRAYNARRSHFWEKALALLTSEQQKSLSKRMAEEYRR